jgi:hypothetical protein
MPLNSGGGINAPETMAPKQRPARGGPLQSSRRALRLDRNAVIVEHSLKTATGGLVNCCCNDSTRICRSGNLPRHNCSNCEKWGAYMGATNGEIYKLPALAACLFYFIAPAGAEPLTTAGIGVASCEKLAKDMNPAEGFNNNVNALIFYWVQGYMSAANIALLEGDSQYVDLARMDEKKLLPMIQDFCKKNPDKKPISLIDKLIEDSEKSEAKWKSGTVPWAADDD